MTRHRKTVFKCDREGCGAVLERIDSDGTIAVPQGWSIVDPFTADEKLYCPRHKVKTSVFDLVDGNGTTWTEEK